MVLQHHVLPDGELHDSHGLYVFQRQVHRVVVRIVAHQLDASRLVGTVHVFYGQIVVAIDVEGYQVHFPIDDVVQTADFLEADDVSRLEYGIHAVPADIHRPVTLGYIGDADIFQQVGQFMAVAGVDHNKAVAGVDEVGAGLLVAHVVKIAEDAERLGVALPGVCHFRIHCFSPP